MAAKRKAGRGTSRTSGSSRKSPTKAQIYAVIAERTELSKAQVSSIFVELSALAGDTLSRGAGVFTVPGLCKLTVRMSPARKARKGINPFTGEEMLFKAKPRSKTVRARAVGAIRESVSAARTPYYCKIGRHFTSRPCPVHG